MLLVLTSCDESFIAFEDNDLVFSIYGYLDPSRDTQWLRVTPLRTSIETVPGPIGAVVTIEEVGTGRTIVMSDSAFAYRPLDQLGSELYAHNFSTSERLFEGHTYEVRAIRPDGASSHTIVSIPLEAEEIWVVVRKRQGIPPDMHRGLDRLRVFGVEHVAFVETVQVTPNGCDYDLPNWREWQQPLSPEANFGDLYFQLGWGLARPSFLGSVPCGPGTQDVAVTVAAVPWPFDPTQDRRASSYFNVIDAVANGVGFVAGVLIREFPYEPEQCILTVPAEFCDIVFDSESVTLEGRVIESCDGEPLSDVAVSLGEVSGTRIRPATTDSTGYFRIRGLEPETTYRLAVTRTRFISHETDLEFSVAENRTLPTIELEWEFAFDPCQIR